MTVDEGIWKAVWVGSGRISSYSFTDEVADSLSPAPACLEQLRSRSRIGSVTARCHDRDIREDGLLDVPVGRHRDAESA
jgi:hypothetical protein